MWTATIVAEAARPPELGSLKGTGFVGPTAEEEEQQASGFWERPNRQIEGGYPWHGESNRRGSSPSKNSRPPICMGLRPESPC